MIRKICLALTVLCLAACQNSAHVPSPAAAPQVPADERGTVNNGSDIHSPAEGAAWFLGTRPVRYCYQLDPKFGVDSRTAETLLKAAFESWRRYLLTRKVTDPSIHPERSMLAQGRDLVLNSTLLPHCDQTQDLTFVLGGEPNTVETGRYTRPLAFARLVRYDAVDGWGNGKIWIAGEGFYQPQPSWHKSRFGLGAVILHELGHVLGCRHVSNTIMDDGIASVIEMAGDSIGELKVPAIDTPYGRELMPYYQTDFGPGWWPSHLFIFQDNAVILLPELAFIGLSQPLYNVRLIDQVANDAPIFKVAYRARAEGSWVVAQSSTNTNIYTASTSPESAPNLLLTHNGSSGPLVIEPVSDAPASWRRVFRYVPLVQRLDPSTPAASPAN